MPTRSLDPASLAFHYSGFRVSERTLLTGHSHQAWPDAGFEGQKQAWLDAAEYVDAKWEPAEETAERVREWLGHRMNDAGGLIALGQNTHELVTRFLSALDLRSRPKVVTTDGEFHSIRRQLDRLAEEGLEVAKVPALPASTLPERLAEVVDETCAAVMVSRVLFQNAHIVGPLAPLVHACRRYGVELLVDAYHAVNAIPFSIRDEDLEDAYVVGGGYKYLQMGEGVCFLRFPQDCLHRPVFTGWFSEFATLAVDPERGRVPYGAGVARYSGSTYDPTSHYRALAVAQFFDEQELDVDLLRDCSRTQVGRLATGFDELDADAAMVARDRSVPLDEVGGFLALATPHAGTISAALHERGISTDFRGETLRLGPAPYVTDRQIDDAIVALGEVLDRMVRTRS